MKRVVSIRPSVVGKVAITYLYQQEDWGVNVLYDGDQPQVAVSRPFKPDMLRPVARTRGVESAVDSVPIPVCMMPAKQR